MEEINMETTQEAALVAGKGRKRGQNGLGSTYKHNGSWWMDVRIRGERHREKLGPIKLLEKRQADKIKEARITAIMMPKPPEPPPVKGTMPFSEFAEKFCAWACETKRSWEPYRGKTPDRTPFLHAARFFGETPLKDITTDLVENFQKHLQLERAGSRRLKKASVNRYVSLLRNSFYWAITKDFMERNPVASLKKKMLDESKSPTRVLEPEEDKKLLEALPNWLRLMTILALQTAARRGEVVNLKWEAVHPENIELCETKGGESRTVRLSSDAKAVLVMARPKSIAAGEFVFEPSVPRKKVVSRIRREWARAWKKAKLPKVRFHDLRHTALTRLIQCGVDVRTVQDIAGHSSVKTTQRYLHSNDKIQQAAVEKLSEFGRHMPTASKDELERTPATATIN
jgi:integrase